MGVSVDFFLLLFDALEFFPVDWVVGMEVPEVLQLFLHTTLPTSASLNSPTSASALPRAISRRGLLSKRFSIRHSRLITSTP